MQLSVKHIRLVKSKNDVLIVCARKHSSLEDFTELKSQESNISTGSSCLQCHKELAAAVCYQSFNDNRAMTAVMRKNL